LWISISASIKRSRRGLEIPKLEERIDAIMNSFAVQRVPNPKPTIPKARLLWRSVESVWDPPTATSHELRGIDWQSLLVGKAMSERDALGLERAVPLPVSY
jgi:hypothetical protein